MFEGFFGSSSKKLRTDWKELSESVELEQIKNKYFSSYEIQHERNP